MKNTRNNNERNCLYNALVQELKEIVQKLKDMGLKEKDISSLLLTEQPLQKLTVSRSHRIYLGENHKEVHLEPLVRSVYILFLRHPEGILFKDLPDYRKELAKIYSEVRPYGLSERALQSIEDVTTPCLNSINEKCARIRSAFVKEFDEHLAKNYFITGERGEAKKIALPRDLVVWE